MAQQGFYADPPGRRMAYDEDGSLFLSMSETFVITQFNNATARISNGEEYTAIVDTGGFGGGGGETYIIIFPELRDISHMYRNILGGVTSETTTIQTSINTTNGLDGDWVNGSAFIAYAEPTNPNFRDPVALPNNYVKAIRFQTLNGSGFDNTDPCQWHLYGTKSAGETPHRIDFCDVSGNELVIDHDFGDQARNSEKLWSPSNTWNQSTALYLKNRSTTKQATDVAVTHEVINGDMSTYLTLSKDNVTYGSSANYSTINPQQIVGPIYVKHSPTLSATLGVKVARLQVVVGTWL